jgi:hypothetical protein
VTLARHTTSVARAPSEAGREGGRGEGRGEEEEEEEEESLGGDGDTFLYEACRFQREQEGTGGRRIGNAAAAAAVVVVVVVLLSSSGRQRTRNNFSEGTGAGELHVGIELPPAFRYPV